MLAWNQRQVQKLTPGEIWLFIIGRVLVALGVGMIAALSFPELSRPAAVPLVVVGLSTTHQAHDSLLERIVAALATLPVRALVTTGSATLGSTPAANVHVARFVPHARVLPQAAAVVTHAGLGTVHAALAHGLPLVCLPIGRDQPDNAARVEWHGAGLRLSPKSSPAVIRAAVERVLRDPAFAASARRLASAFVDERPAERAPSALEAVAGHVGSARATTPRPTPASEVVSPG